jgi:hypothetical protein
MRDTVLRLTSRFWVDAYLTRLRAEGILGFVVAHGDDTAGAVLVKLNTLDGCATLFQRSFDLMLDMRRWVELTSGAEVDVEATVATQRGFDPDLWVIEVEDRQGRHMLNDEGLS